MTSGIRPRGSVRTLIPVPACGSPRSAPRAGSRSGNEVDVIGGCGRDVSEVIRLTSQHLNGLPRSQALVTEVVAQAHLFRDIRNYALHPVEDDDEDRQAWLTESGATCSPLPGVATSFGSLNF